jgi:tetratricopeptide (TPR) repeat protein
MLGACICSAWALQVRKAMIPAAASDKSHVKSLESLENVGKSTVWQLRKSLAVITWAKAQTYFHGGFDLTAFVRNKQAEKKVVSAMQGETPEEAHEKMEEESAGEAQDEHDKEDVEHGVDLDMHSTAEVIRIRSLKGHPFLQRSLLRPYVFRHVDSGEGAKRMMPFYWLTTQLDPNYIRAYTNGAWWLAMRFDKVPQAMDYLAKGIQYNPDEYSLYSRRGEILFYKSKDYEKATDDLTHAIRLNPATSDSEKQDLMTEYSLLASSYLYLRKYALAIETAYEAKRKGAGTIGFDSVISDATRPLEEPAGTQ